MDSDRLLVACPHCAATNRLPAERLGDGPVCGKCGQPLLQGQPLTLTDATFDAVARHAGLPLVVDFWAPWCGPCRMMAPAFEQAGRQMAGRALFAKVDSDENPGLAQRFAVRSIPTLVRVEGGVPTRRATGALPAAQIVAFAS